MEARDKLTRCCRWMRGRLRLLGACLILWSRCVMQQVTRHTSHCTRHTSHLTPHTLQVAAYGLHSFAVTQWGSVVAWGDNSRGVRWPWFITEFQCSQSCRFLVSGHRSHQLQFLRCWLHAMLLLLLLLLLLLPPPMITTQVISPPCRRSQPSPCQMVSAHPGAPSPRPLYPTPPLTYKLLSCIDLTPRSGTLRHVTRAPSQMDVRLPARTRLPQVT